MAPTMLTRRAVVRGAAGAAAGLAGAGGYAQIGFTRNGAFL